MTATPNQSNNDQWLSDISAGAGIVSGIEKGGASGDIQAGLGAAKLGANTGLLSSGLNNTIGELNNLAAIYSGIQKGGVLGYGSAAVNTGQLAENLGAISSTSAVGEAIPVLGAALSIVNFADNWQSGAAGSDALAGAGTGVSIGSLYGPVGAVVGGIIGGVVGAASSWLGPGETDPEQATWGSYFNAFQGGSQQAQAAQENQAGVGFGAELTSPTAMKGQIRSAVEGTKVGQTALTKFAEDQPAAQSAGLQGGAAAVAGAPPQATFQALSGLFDARASTLPFYSQFGRQGEGAFTVAMATQINSALAKGTINPSDSAQTIFQKVISPWISSMPGGANWTTDQGTNENTIPAISNLLTQIIGQYQSGQLNSTTKVTVGGGGSITGLPSFGAAGYSAATQQAQRTVTQNMSPLNEATLSMPGVASSSSSSASSMLPLLLAMPALLGGANAVPSAINPGTQVGVAGTDPAAAAQIGAGTTPSGGDGSLLSDIGSFLSGSGGTALEAGFLAPVALSQANAQKGTNDALAATLSTPGQPFTAAGQAELGQIQGGPAVGGPLGASITQQTTAATELGNVATADSTGNLTPAQSSQVQDFIKQQRAMVDTQLAASGTSDSSARQAAYQQIDDNAAQLTQSLTQQNVATGTAALNAVQQTYSSLLTQALNSSEFGFSTQLAAVQTQIQADTALAASLNQLFAGIAQGYGNAVGSGAKAGAAAGGLLGAAGKAIGSAVSGGSSSAPYNGGTGDNGGPGLPSSGIGAAGYNPDGTPISGSDSGATAYGYDQNVSPDASLSDFSSDPFDGGLS